MRQAQYKYCHPKATVLILIYLSQVPISEINGSYYAFWSMAIILFLPVFKSTKPRLVQAAV
jgi:hypothetical protein